MKKELTKIKAWHKKLNTVYGYDVDNQHKIDVILEEMEACINGDTDVNPDMGDK